LPRGFELRFERLEAKVDDLWREIRAQTWKLVSVVIARRDRAS
jgi:hypothetical protein